MPRRPTWRWQQRPRCSARWGWKWPFSARTMGCNEGPKRRIDTNWRMAHYCLEGVHASISYRGGSDGSNLRCLVTGGRALVRKNERSGRHEFLQGYAVQADGSARAAAFGRLHRALLSLCILVDSLETVRGNHMVSACQSVEREPPPNGGIRALAVVGRYPQPSRRIPLCIEGARSRASSGF